MFNRKKDLAHKLNLLETDFKWYKREAARSWVGFWEEIEILQDKMDAIANHLGIDFKTVNEVPSFVKAVKRSRVVGPGPR